ncbi:MAG: glycosyltransferase family 1 protein, partial [Verrucomicrobia bacterium]|nr:glycosyltransferase family 1 protein [Verrucomicrobiota bacterium]
TRLFEGAACGTAIISDRWPGLEQFLEPGREVLTVDSTDEVVQILSDLPDEERKAIGARARARILSAHTAEQRVILLERLLGSSPRPQRLNHHHFQGHHE